MDLETTTGQEYHPILVDNPIIVMYENWILRKGVDGDLFARKFHDAKVEFTKRNSPLDYPITLSYLRESLDSLKSRGVSLSSTTSDELDSMLKQIEKERAETIGYYP
ncbi:hypothetical protein HY449_01835 [Candidatus Pacearchaeota archaeon]|nr:hypothetical protein [Candidatus Pacearchaeota archaeon]